MSNVAAPWWRWVIPIFVAFCVFVNHYARDSVGAIEKQMEEELQISASQYAMLTALYFFPNMITPLIAGLLANWLGASMVLVYGVVIGSIGHICFAFGCQYRNISLLFLGRAIAGCMYEVIDFVPVLFVSPLFEKEWGFVCGVLNGFIRLGSVTNFVAGPIAYRVGGVTYAMWVSAWVFCTGVFYSCICSCTEAKLRKHLSAHTVEPVDHNYTNISYESHYNNSSMEGSSSLLRSGEAGFPPTNDVSSVSVSSLGTLDSICSVETMTDDDEFSVYFRTPEDEKVTLQSPSPSCCTRLVEQLPLHEFGMLYYFYLGAGMFLYGAMVPFWFISSKYLQQSYGLSMEVADSYVLYPEGLIVIIAPPLGFVLSFYQVSSFTSLLIFAAGTLLLPLGYICLIFGIDSHPDDSVHIVIEPWVSIVILGVGYAFSNGCFWTVFPDMLPNKKLQGSAGGLIASCMNMLPTLVPVVITAWISSPQSHVSEEQEGRLYLWVMICCGLVSMLLALCAACCVGAPSQPSTSNTPSFSEDSINTNNPMLDNTLGTNIRHLPTHPDGYASVPATSSRSFEMSEL